MGSSGGSYSLSSSRSSEDISKILKRAGESTDTSSYNAEVNSLLQTALKDFNDRDVDATQQSGYHAESLAIEAFKNYQGSRTYKDMLTHLCREATNLVKSPIKDKTGQSLHVDDSLGEANSQARTSISVYLKRLTNRIEASDKLKSKEQWQEWFGE